MAKTSTLFACTNCGATSSTWSGRCYSCGEWNTLEEQTPLVSSAGRPLSGANILKTSTIDSATKQTTSPRLKTAIADVDNVLGGGFMPGSVVLVAGQPGIGKSTLLLQIAGLLGQKNAVLYASGEESISQLAQRAKRLRVHGKKLELVSTNDTDAIASTIMQGGYKAVIVDSIQTLATQQIQTPAGSVGQITNSTHLLSEVAKKTNTLLIIVGHVTKEGSIAGPKVLEHLVDVVMQFEGDRYGGFKVLRGVKNRYGSTNEVGIFEMTETGLDAVQNPSAALLSERQVSDGSIVLATMEGSRPVLVEVQALVHTTAYGYPKRTASGLDLNRVNLLVAMLEKRTKLRLSDKDIYINIVGGIRVTEPAADLAVCMAIASASKGMQLSKNAVVFGEAGLSGEIRHVPFIDRRIQEAQKLGFEAAIGPSSKLKQIDKAFYLPVTNVKSALNTFLNE